MNWLNLIGMKVVALRGMTWSKSQYDKTLQTPRKHILFDDGETFIELRSQDPYDYHDCSQSARNLDLCKDKKTWERMFNKEQNFNEPDDLNSPFN